MGACFSEVVNFFFNFGIFLLAIKKPIKQTFQGEQILNRYYSNFEFPSPVIFSEIWTFDCLQTFWRASLSLSKYRNIKNFTVHIKYLISLFLSLSLFPSKKLLTKEPTIFKKLEKLKYYGIGLCAKTRGPKSFIIIAPKYLT